MFNIIESWKEKLKVELQSAEFIALSKFVAEEYATKKVYPPKEKVFRCLNEIPFDEIRVVILGQDPYHGEGQANGFAFAVDNGVPLPPSLKNIMDEVRSDILMPKYGSEEQIKSNNVSFDKTLYHWAKQGVLLLNTTLTVRGGAPLSHSGIGWETLTDKIIEKISDRQKPLVFILWGSNAIKKEKLIVQKHCIIKSPHPSPLSAYRGFFGSRPFSRANDFLIKNGMDEIEWAVVPKSETTKIED